MIVHRFSGYTLVPADATCAALAHMWTMADPDHAGRVKPEFWIEQGEGIESWLLYDRLGAVYFFKSIRQDLDIEIHIQFPPYPVDARMNHHCRISLALVEGMHWLENRIRGKIREVRFESRNPSLIRFAEKHLGFTNENGQLSKRLEATDVRKYGSAIDDSARTN